MTIGKKNLRRGEYGFTGHGSACPVFRRPGHIFPLVARPGGVLERRGHTEAAVDMMRLAGLPPAGVLCELTNDDGTMSGMPEIMAFAARERFTVLSVEDLAAYRKETAA